MRGGAFDDARLDVLYSLHEPSTVTIFATAGLRRCCAGGAPAAEEIAKSPKSLFGVPKWAILLRFVFARSRFFEELTWS